MQIRFGTTYRQGDVVSIDAGDGMRQYTEVRGTAPNGRLLTLPLTTVDPGDVYEKVMPASQIQG